MQKTSWLFLLMMTGLALLAAYQAFTGVPAATAIIRFFGLGGFSLLCISLMISPLITFWPKEMAPLLEPRRAIGIASFVFILLHFALAATLYFSWDIGFMLNLLPIVIVIPALIMAAALAITSSDYAIQKLGVNNWKTLQRLAYVMFVLIFAHFLLQSNGLFSGRLNASEYAVLGLALVTVGLRIAAFVKKRMTGAQASL